LERKSYTLSKPPSIPHCEAETPIDGSDQASDQARFADKTGSLANLACARVCVVLTKDGETWYKSTSGFVQEWWVSVNPIIGFAESGKPVIHQSRYILLDQALCRLWHPWAWYSTTGPIALL
jgi:hypothetical protein